MELEATLESIGAPLLRYCLARTGRADLAEDVAQEAARALVDRWRRFGPPEEPLAFACAIARRKAWRHRARERLLSPLAVLGPRRSAAVSPEEQTAQRRQVVVALAALERLPKRDREVLELIALADLDLAASAEILRITPSAAKMRLHRARRRLVQVVQAMEGKERAS